jgi:hypothetical protein
MSGEVAARPQPRPRSPDRDDPFALPRPNLFEQLRK